MFLSVFHKKNIVLLMFHLSHHHCYPYSEIFYWVFWHSQPVMPLWVPCSNNVIIYLKTWYSNVRQLLQTASAPLFQTPRAGMVYVAIDQNPGRFLCLRVEALSFDTEVGVCQ